MPRLRFTIRRMMVAVAIMSVASAAAILFWRHLVLSERADYHEMMERVQAERVRGLEELALAASTSEVADRVRADATIEAKIRDRHARLKGKYRHLARHPWLPVAPDPPEPE
jgi:hypothetical protein